jgi:hypothetical protein
MTNEEGQRIKAQLIELGLWGVDEKGVFIVSRILFGRSWDREVVIFHTHQEDKLATAPTYIAAISLAALAAPEFLRQHPECAAEPDQI